MVAMAARVCSITNSPYDCTPELLQVARSLNAQCRPNGTQYDQFAVGNTDGGTRDGVRGAAGVRYTW